MPEVHLDQQPDVRRVPVDPVYTKYSPLKSALCTMPISASSLRRLLPSGTSLCKSSLP